MKIPALTISWQPVSFSLSTFQTLELFVVLHFTLTLYLTNKHESASFILIRLESKTQFPQIILRRSLCREGRVPPLVGAGLSERCLRP